MPDELLSSWLVRLASANGLKLQTFCDRVFGKEHQLWNRDIDRLAPKWLLTAIGRHTGTSAAVVRRTTLDIYRGRLYRHRHSAGQLRWILPAGIYHRTRRRFGMQFCPQCLAEDDEPYFRTRWRVAVLTFCPEHRLCLHDRCPSCAAPVAYHRREMGQPSITDPGPLSLCHACSFDLRDAAREVFSPCAPEIGMMLDRIAMHATGYPSGLRVGHLDVLHQLCKTMVSLRPSANLAAFVTRAVGTASCCVPRGRQAFELRAITERRRIVQLATWLLAEPQTRLPAAWRAEAVRYSDLVRDFPQPPQWYRAIVGTLNRKSRHFSLAASHACPKTVHRRTQSTTKRLLDR